MRNSTSYTVPIAIFFILLFHISGFIGMCFTSYTQWFLNNTPLNLLVAFVAVFLAVPTKSNRFYGVSFAVMLAGWFVEYIGITTFFPFGAYDYNNSILGTQLLGVPLILGINWWLQVYGYGTIAHVYTNNQSTVVKSLLAAAMMVASDVPMEFLANKIGLWYWHEGFAPLQNYVGWFVYGFIFQYFAHHNQIFEQNRVAVVYCMTTFTFFSLLLLFLF